MRTRMRAHNRYLLAARWSLGLYEASGILANSYTIKTTRAQKCLQKRLVQSRRLQKRCEYGSEWKADTHKLAIGIPELWNTARTAALTGTTHELHACLKFAQSGY